ncbi:membrane protein insertion efficiency factor YidD [Zeimonas arvi]|uniref:Putative membrane protein insertion efficiency factor n=1 Tax=Zeimonas arvi TaxID=2498847 RepID=A0A5C8NUC5_9BURK|nr:membrane protein insertion efficiency factor YidD [Zeimonas arvi]TXL64766.1 membrane protein insertion efficiency factor YidD [Zeimonas arvi]
MKALLMMLVRAYRLAISPLFPPRCRFLPSCSDYALQAVERHGALAGGWLALRRFARCHPFNPGGIDEVPERLDQPGEGPGAGLGSRLRCQCHRPFNR